MNSFLPKYLWVLIVTVTEKKKTLTNKIIKIQKKYLRNSKSHLEMIYTGYREIFVLMA